MQVKAQAEYVGAIAFCSLVPLVSTKDATKQQIVAMAHSASPS